MPLQIEFPQYPEINNIHGIKLTSFDTSILTPGDIRYFPDGVKALTQKFKTQSAEAIRKVLPPILVYPNYSSPSSPELSPINIVIDGNHRAAGAHKAKKSIDAIIMDSQDDVDICRKLLILRDKLNIEPKLWPGLNYFKSKKIITIDQVREDIQMRIRHKIFKDFDEYLKKARKAKPFMCKIAG